MLSVIKKLTKGIYMIRNLVKLIPPHTLKLVYHACFCSHMSYAILCWGGSTHAAEVFRVQRRCVRVMTGLGYRDCCRQKFIELRILTFPCIYILTCLLHIRDHLDDYTRLHDNHHYNTRNNNDLLIRYTRIQRSRDGITYYGIRFFNALPAAVQVLSTTRFKRIIKDYLIVKAFYDYDEFFASDFGDLQRAAESVVPGAAPVPR